MSGFSWLEGELKRKALQESSSHRAREVVEDFNLAAVEAMKPSQLKRLEDAASQGASQAKSFIENQKKRLKTRDAWKIHNKSGGKALAAELEGIFDSYEKIEREHKIAGLVASFVRQLIAWRVIKSKEA